MLDERAFADALAETTQALVCVFDRDGLILLFNDACERATGFARDEVLGTDIRERLIPHEQTDAFGELLAGIWETGMPSPQVGHWMRKDGGRVLIAWSNRPVLGDDGTPLYLVTSGLDITGREREAAERRALEGDLEAKLAEVGRLAQEQAALRRVATLVAGEAGQEQVFEAVSKQAARVLGAGAAAVFRFDADGTATVVGRYDGDGVGAFPAGATIPLDAAPAMGRVRTTGKPARIDDYGDLPGPVAEIMRNAGLRSTVAAPITVGGAVWGAVAVTTPEARPFPPESEARLGDFCGLVSLAVASASARAELRASRARIVHAADTERRRLERNLHDGAQQRLVALQISLRLARARLGDDLESASALLASALTELGSAIGELRELARGLHPVILTERGLRPALDQLADRAPLPVVVAATPAERLPEPVEAAAYYVVAEALTNVAKHAQASQAQVAVRCEDAVARVEVRDDGCGGADLGGGSGLVGLRDRVDALGGSLAIESPSGAGTVVRALLPL
jgi:PAS domain S-box-containing protein